MIISRSFAIVGDPNKFDSYNELGITRMSSVLPFFRFAPMFMHDYLKFQGYPEKKNQSGENKPIFSWKKD